MSRARGRGGETVVFLAVGSPMPALRTDVVVGGERCPRKVPLSHPDPRVELPATVLAPDRENQGRHEKITAGR